MTTTRTYSFGQVLLSKMTIGGSFWPFTWQPRTTVKPDFSVSVVCIVTTQVPAFSTVRTRGMSKMRGLIRVCDVFWPHFLFIDLVRVVGAEQGHLFFVSLSSSCDIVVLVRMQRLRHFIKQKHQEEPPRKSLISMSRATAVAFS